jgi:hypothetical protein
LPKLNQNKAEVNQNQQQALPPFQFFLCSDKQPEQIKDHQKSQGGHQVALQPPI